MPASSDSILYVALLTRPPVLNALSSNRRVPSDKRICEFSIVLSPGCDCRSSRLCVRPKPKFVTSSSCSSKSPQPLRPPYSPCGFQFKDAENVLNSASSCTALTPSWLKLLPSTTLYC